MSAPTFTLPDNIFSLTNWLLTTPEGQSTFQPYADLVNRIQGASGTIPHSYTYTVGGFSGPGVGSPHTIRHRDPTADAYNTIEGIDAFVLPWLSMFDLSQDPRADIQQQLQNRLNYYRGMPGWQDQVAVDESTFAQDFLPSAVAEAALRQKWDSLGVTDAEQNRLASTFFNQTPGQGLIGSFKLGNAPYPSQSNPFPTTDPFYALSQQIFDDYRFTGNFSQDPNYGFQTTDDQWKDLLTNAGVQFTADSQNVVPFPGSNPVSTTSDNQLQTLSYLAPWLSLITGGYSDKDGWHPLTPEQWQTRYGSGGIFGTEQMQAIQDLMNPLPLNQHEQGSRDLLSTDPQVRNAALANYPDLANALNILDTKVLPGYQQLLDGNLYNPEQYQLAEQLARTGNRGLLEDAAMSFLTQQVAPNLSAAYGAQLGTYGSDFSGELANQSRLMQAELAPIVNQNMLSGLGMWSDMTSAESMFDAQLLPQLEAAAVRRGNLPMAWATDLANFGGAARTTDEALRPGRNIMDLYRQFLTGAAPSNMGFVMQGENPSATASWLNGLGQQSAAFGSGLGGIIPSFAQSLGSALGRNLFSGGGFDSNGSMGILGDLGGLLGNVGSSIFSGISGLFGSGSSGIFGNNNWSGGSGYDFSNWA